MDAFTQVMKHMWKKFSGSYRLRRSSARADSDRVQPEVAQTESSGRRISGCEFQTGNLLKKPLLLMDSQIALQKLGQAEFTDGTGEVGCSKKLP